MRRKPRIISGDFIYRYLLRLFLEPDGLKVIRHEGMKPANMLSMVFSVMLFAYLTVWPAMGRLGRSLLGTRLYILISLMAFYLLSLLAIYSLSAVLNLIHLKKKRRADYIVVLGAGLIGARVTPLLAARIDKGIELLARNPRAVLILSGGQGPGEDLAEGRAMADYAVQKGVDPEKIMVEDKSGSTEENLRFSKELMSGEKPRWYFTLNALLREFAGYLSLTWKRHAIVAVLTAGTVAMIFH